MASSASLIVTPFKFRAATSRPSGKCRSIFLTGGVVRSFLRTAGSSTVLGDLLSFQFSFCVSGAILISILSLSDGGCVSSRQGFDGTYGRGCGEAVVEKCSKGVGKGKLTQVIDVHDARVTRACSFLAGLCFRILTDAADGRVNLGEI